MPQTTEADDLKRDIVGYLLDNDEKFRTAAKEFIANNFPEDSSLRSIFKDKAGATINRLFGFRNSPKTKAVAKPKTKPVAKPKKKKAKSNKAKSKAAAKAAATRKKASSNTMTHNEAILKVIGNSNKALSMGAIIAGLKKLKHSMSEDSIPNALSKLKRDGALRAVPHAGSGKAKYDWTVAAQ